MASSCPVLVVDDDPAIRDMLTYLIEEEGYSVVSARNGLDAIQKLRAENIHPCLIMLDLMMPTMNGWQFRHEQQQDPELCAIPVVVVSALVHAQHKPVTIEADGYLSKPIDYTSLQNILKQFCR